MTIFERIFCERDCILGIYCNIRECNKFLDFGLKGDGSLKRGCGRRQMYCSMNVNDFGKGGMIPRKEDHRVGHCMFD